MRKMESEIRALRSRIRMEKSRAKRQQMTLAPEEQQQWQETVALQETLEGTDGRTCSYNGTELLPLDYWWAAFCCRVKLFKLRVISRGIDLDLAHVPFLAFSA